MEWRGVTTTNVYIGNFFFVAGIGMLISAQWELVKGNSFAYTVLSAFGKLSCCSVPQFFHTVTFESWAAFCAVTKPRRTE